MPARASHDWPQEPHGSATEGMDMDEELKAPEATEAIEQEETTVPEPAEPAEPQGTDFKAESRKWERRAKDSHAQIQQLQEQMDALKADLEAKLAAKDAELEQREIVAEVAKAKGVDAELLGRMVGNGREAVEQNAALLASAMAAQQRPGYPRVSDQGAAPVPPTSIESIESIQDPVARIHARAAHISAYNV